MFSNKTFVALVLFALLFQLSPGIIIPHPHAKGRSVPRYSVNIEDEPKVRWGQLVADFKPALITFIQEFNSLIPVPNFFYTAIGYYGETLFKYQDFVEEIQAIADLAGLDFGEVFTLNFFYEITSWKMCTSVVARTDDNRIIHGRNLDFEFFRYFANLTAIIDYHKNGKLLFTVDTIVGAAFFHTGLRHGAFGISVNERHTGSIFDNIYALVFKQSFPAVWFVREVLTNAENYTQAVEMLKTQDVVSPVYYIVSGYSDNEGCVIERDRDGVHAFYELNETNWFLVQTNYDRDIKDPYYDGRRLPTEQKLKDLSLNLDEQVLIDHVMSQWPEFNLASLLTTTMSPQSKYFNTTAWW